MERRPRFTFVVDRSNRTGVAQLVASLETELVDPAASLRTIKPAQAASLRLGGEDGIADCVCMSAMTENFGERVALLEAVRHKGGGEFVAVCGGPHATADPEGVLAAGFDVCAVGEGEEVVREIARRLVSGESLARSGKRGVKIAGTPADLDRLPALPERVRFRAYIEIGRGCRWGCAYCQTPQIFGHRERFRSPEAIERTIARYAASGMKDFRLLLPNALGYMSERAGSPNCEMLEELLRRARLAAGAGRVFLGSVPSEMRPEYVTAEAFGVLKKYVANRQVVIGAQSASQRVLDEAGRGHSAEVIREACRIAVGYGFLPTVDIVLGFPTEEAADRQASLDLIERLRQARAIVNMHFFMPLPGTPLARSVPRFLTDAEHAVLDDLGLKGVIRGRWRVQEEIARKWVADRVETTPSR
ncbi:MAG: TIGR04013 family B12-binding domain/radical SAM domain-containing protein [bacterium]